ncbi:MAG: molybdopterin-dependent oxidoreductase [Pseudomonadota bacterium]
MPKLELLLNGRQRSIEVPVDRVLVDCIREDFRLTGTHIGCDSAQCGACTVSLNGKSVKSCTLLAHQTQGASLVTIEGLADRDELHPLQVAFSKSHALQCGFCTSGMIMRALDIADTSGPVSSDEIRRALGGNLCRCTGYHNIVAAIEQYRDANGLKPQSTESTSASVKECEPERGARVEDRRLLTGDGQFTSDLSAPEQCHAFFVRSSVAHAQIQSIDVGAARSADGVLAVYTAADLLKHDLGKPECSWRIANLDGSPMHSVTRPLLAVDKVRYVGEPVAVVIAESTAQARSAGALVNVDYIELSPMLTPEHALDPEAPQLHDCASGNRAFHWQLGDSAALDQVIAEAPHVVYMAVPVNRVQASCMEPRAALAQHSASDGKFTLFVTTQNPHVARRVLAEDVRLAPEHLIDVVSSDVGGSFGSKIFVYSEECLCLWASRELNRPVKWVSTRAESFQQDVHGRDIQTEATLALGAEGEFLGLKVKATANLGAYMSPFAAIVPTFNFATMLVGPYTTPEIHCDVTGVYTNTTPVDAYRGAGRPDATYVVETIIDLAARELGMDRLSLRRRNLISREQIPYQTPDALVYDSGDYTAHFEKALKLADLQGFDERKAASASQGLLRGFGLANYLEACGIGPSAIAGALGAEYGLWEVATLRFLPTGMLEVITGSHAQGQGHETTFSRIIEQRLNLSREAIRVLHGDTRASPVGMGTYGSRSLVVGGSAISRALDKLIEKGRLIAAHLLFCDTSDLRFENGVYTHIQNTESIGLKDVVRAAYAPHDYPEELEPGFEATCFYDPVNFTYPSGTHVCEVEVDPQWASPDIRYDLKCRNPAHFTQ